MTDAHPRDISTADFDREVVERSAARPVLVDFWAAWCQPCLLLAPILAELAGHYGDRLEVVKVNADREPQLASRFGVRSLPTVMLFVDGKIAVQFSGLMPARRIQAIIEPHLPRPSDRLRQQAAEALAAGRHAEAAGMLREALESDPENWRIHPQLAEALVLLGELDEAERVIRELPANLQQEQDAQRLTARILLARTAAEHPDRAALEQAVAAGGSLEQRFALSAHQALAGEYEAAMDNLMGIIREDRAFRDDGARRAMLAIFTILDNEGPLVRRYRSLLSAALN
jgi:putative thioredoxin